MTHARLPRSYEASLAAFPELTRVSLTGPVATQQQLLPTGATGTVVHVYRDGEAYEVEFTQPFHCLVTVPSTDLRAGR